MQPNWVDSGCSPECRPKDHVCDKKRTRLVLPDYWYFDGDLFGELSAFGEDADRATPVLVVDHEAWREVRTDLDDCKIVNDQLRHDAARLAEGCVQEHDAPDDLCVWFCFPCQRESSPHRRGDMPDKWGDWHADDCIAVKWRERPCPD